MRNLPSAAGALSHRSGTPGGRLVLGFSTVIGRLELVEQIAAEVGLEARITAREEGTADFPMPTELIEFFPRD